jgi:hypothetical protein
MAPLRPRVRASEVHAIENSSWRDISAWTNACRRHGSCIRTHARIHTKTHKHTQTKHTHTHTHESCSYGSLSRSRAVSPSFSFSLSLSLSHSHSHSLLLSLSLALSRSRSLSFSLSHTFTRGPSTSRVCTTVSLSYVHADMGVSEIFVHLYIVPFICLCVSVPLSQCVSMSVGYSTFALCI